MADTILSFIISTANDYLIDLGFISKKLGDKALNKGTETIRKSLFSSLQDYAKQGSAELDEKLEKLKE
jgi:hypothetical protein